MTRTIRRPRRGAFTLVEVLVVVSILAILAALATAAFYRVRASQSISASEATISKLKSGLGRKWTAVLENANKAALSDGLITFAGGDRDRAKVMLTYLMLKNEFPTTFPEAGVPTGSVAVSPALTARPFTTLEVPVGSAVAGVPTKVSYAAPVIEYLKKYYNGQTVTISFGNTPEDSAALFYLALTASGTRGETMTGDGLQGQVGEVKVSIKINGQEPTQPLSLSAYIDAWGSPISFSRQTYLPELDGGEYSKVKPVPAGRPLAGSTLRDPLDLQGKLLTFDLANPSPTWTPVKLAQFWAGLFPGDSKHWDYGGFPATYQVTPQPTNNNPNGPFAVSNWQPAIISAGANKKLATAAGANFGGDDDLISVRMAREGNKGN
ncbi:MAG: prepilin-type N-terminal cleavage/methylation domain-containing protein [Gemmataceae bacterium]